MFCLCCPHEWTNDSISIISKFTESFHLGSGCLLEETISCWIVQPWIMIWTSYTGLHVYQLSGNLFRCQSARIWYPTSWLGVEINCTLLSPWLKVLDFARSFWILHPLNDLSHRYKIDIVMISQDLVDPIEEGIEELGIVLQPGSMEIETQRGTVRVIVTFKVVIQERVELITWKKSQ